MYGPPPPGYGTPPPPYHGAPGHYPPGGPGYYPHPHGPTVQQEMAYQEGVGAGVATGLAACCCLQLLCCCCLW